MPFKIYFYGNIKLILHYLYSSLSAVDICNNQKFLVTSRWYQFAWLGITINLEKLITDGSGNPAFFFSFETIKDKIKKLFK